jgi:hypothetical protein
VRGAADRRVGDGDHGSGFREELLAVEDEAGAPGGDEVQLLVPALRLVVLADQRVAVCAGDVRVDPERRQAEVVADRIPRRVAGIRRRRHVGKLVEPGGRPARHYAESAASAPGS